MSRPDQMTPTRRLAHDASDYIHDAEQAIEKALVALRIGKPSPRSKRPDRRPTTFIAAAAMLDAAERLAINARYLVSSDESII